MAFKCDNCNKGVMYGHKVSHSKRRTNRTFKPNLQNKRIMVDGAMKRVKLCANCIKLMRKIERDAAKAREVVAEAANATA